MTLITVVGASGSGKTTFLEDVQKIHQCTYIRQYHMARPYIRVPGIPGFDPTKLPFWDIYEREGKADSIQVGGTLAGKFTQGLSGGQRKLLLFDLICQRTAEQRDLDEPFSGVTDGFVPFIKERLEDLRGRHNVILVTNDHVEMLKEMADNIITVSAVDRSVVKLNDREHVDREKVMLALAIGEKYMYRSSNEDLRFFLDVEVLHSAGLRQIGIFAMFTFTLYIATFWNSAPTSAPLVLIAGGIIAFFNLNPYLLGLVEWRNSMLEEAEALVHASATMNRFLKVVLTLSILLILTMIEFGVVNAVTGGMFLEARYWLAMVCDSASLTLPLVCLGLFTKLPFQVVQLLGSSPFLLMVFCSTTFSPGAGVPILKELRYLFPRYYFWCIVPYVEEQMEGCPADNLIPLYLILSAFAGVFILFVILKALQVRKSLKRQKVESKRDRVIHSKDFNDLQVEIYGEGALRRLRHRESDRSSGNSSAAEVSASEDSNV